jgi:hypothetical protein
MFYRNKKTRKYQAPVALATHMALESNFCTTVRYNMQVDELHNMNLEVEAEKRDTKDDPFYFEF